MTRHAVGRAGIAVVAMLTAGLGASPAFAQADRTCTSALGAEAVENVGVPSGATCVMNGTRVGGNVIVNRGATLRLTGGSVEGNIQAEGAARVTVHGSRIGGSFQIEQGGGGDIRSTPVEGDIQLETNNGPAQHVIGNRVGGNVQINANRGGVDVTGNVIDGNLQCQSNDPPPRGGSNTVRGSREDQCASLRPADPAPPPSPGPTPPAMDAARLPALATTSLRTSRRGTRVNVPLRCRTGTARCRGRVRLALRRDRSASAADLGGVRFNLAPGTRRAVTIRLSRRGRTLARTTRRLKVTVTLSAGGRRVNRRAVVR